MSLVPLTLALCCASSASAAAEDERVDGPRSEPSPDGVVVQELVDLQAGEVELSGTRWRALRPDEDRPPWPMILGRTLRLAQVEGGVEVTARWQIVDPTGGSSGRWFANVVIGPQAHVDQIRWNGRDAAVWTGTQGPLVVEQLEAGRAELSLTAFVPGSPQGGLSLALLGAPRGTVQLVGFGEDVTLETVDDERPIVTTTTPGGVVRSTGASALRLAVRQPAARDRGPVVVAHVGMGVTVGDAEIRGHARLRYEIRQGSRAELSFLAQGVGEDLQVEGPQVSRWRREGTDVIVELSGDTQGRVDLDLRWSVAAPPGDEAHVPLPTLVPRDVFRSDAAVQLARDGEVDVRPELPRWSPIASVQLPPWAEGLVEGTPTAAYARARSAEDDATLELLRLTPVPGPPMVVDVADVRVAMSDEGRAAMRIRLEVRNERASHLVVTPPPGMRPVGVMVAGQHVRPSLVDGSLRIPLKRSIETVQGALTVPVTIGLLGEDEAWERRERRSLTLPAVDAPVSVERVTLILPPRYHSRLEPGDGAVVDSFDRGEGVGYSLPDDGMIARADQVFAEAVDAWNDNEFERAQMRLDELAELGARGSNVEGLQANVELVRPRPKPQSQTLAPSDGDELAVYDFEDDSIDGSMAPPAPAAMPADAPAPASALARRIRARARARSGKKKASYERRKRKAKQYKDEGNYEAAAEEYRQAIEDSRDLDALEDEESVEYEFEAAELADELSEVEAAADDGSESDGGGGGGDEGLSDFVASEGEFDLVSAAVGRWLKLDDEDEDEDDEVADGEDEDADANEAPRPQPVGAVVEVPQAGEIVRYQVLLLGAGEARQLRIDARRRLWEREPRRWRWRSYE